MSITAEESRTLLEQIFDVDIVPTSLLRDHLRAALDREAELQVERDAAVEWAEKADAEREAALARAEKAGADGWLYYNPDTGTEWSANHPVESGEVPAAERVRPATHEAMRHELFETWQMQIEAEKRIALIVAERDAAQVFAKRVETDKFKMRDERDKAKIMANNYGNFVHEARKRAEKAEAERDAAKAEIKAMQESGSWFQEKDIDRLQTQVKAAEKMADALERIRPMPERLLRGTPVRDVSETLAEVDSALAAWDASKGE